MVAWPLFAEQRQNAVMLTEGVGVAMRVPATKREEEIAAAVREVMAGQGKGAKVSAKVAALQKVATEALSLREEPPRPHWMRWCANGHVASIARCMSANLPLHLAPSVCVHRDDDVSFFLRNNKNISLLQCGCMTFSRVDFQLYICKGYFVYIMFTWQQVSAT